MADIELVINISEENYKNIKEQVNKRDYPDMQIGKAIADGTPLPKGHGRLIDADELISNICGNSCGCHLEECGYDNPCYSVTRINSAQTIIEADKEQKNGTNK